MGQITPEQCMRLVSPYRRCLKVVITNKAIGAIASEYVNCVHTCIPGAVLSRLVSLDENAGLNQASISDKVGKEPCKVD